MHPPPRSHAILGTRLDATSYTDATQRILAWAEASASRYVCAANVHMVMEGYDDAAFRDVVNGASLITPDGTPLVWMLRGLGLPAQARVYGPTLMLHVCEAAARARLPIGLYGGRPDILAALKSRLERRFPGLVVAYAYGPPFRALSEAEETAVRQAIRASGARILFVGLGCPKQERWMARQRGQLPLVMLGVGAAFDFHAGRIRQAPAWMQRAGLEWAFRLSKEPRRLWQRYLKHNPRFVHLAVKQLWQERR